MDDKKQTKGVCLTSRYDTIAAQHAEATLGEPADLFNNRMAYRMQTYDSDDSDDDSVDIESVSLDEQTPSRPVKAHDNVVASEAHDAPAVVAVTSESLYGHGAAANAAASIEVEEMYIAPIADSPSVNTTTTQPQSEGCMTVLCHNLYMCCCSRCYNRAVKHRVKNEYGIREHSTCYQRCCLCYEFSRKCPTLYNECAGFVSFMRAVRDYIHTTCGRSCRNIGVLRCLFSLCLERRDRIDIDVMIFISSKIIHDAAEVRQMGYVLQDYTFSDFSGFQWNSQLYNSHVVMHYSDLNEAQASAMVGGFVKRRLQNIEHRIDDVLRIMLGCADHPHIIRLLGGHIDEAKALQISTMISVMPKQRNLDVFLVTDASSASYLDNAWRYVLVNNNNITQQYCEHLLSLFSDFINTFYSSYSSVVDYYTYDVPGYVLELMNFVAARKYAFINKGVEDILMLPQGCYLVSCNTMHALTQILLSQKIRYLETIKNPVIIFDALKSATTSSSLEQFMSNMRVIPKLLQHPCTVNAYICRIHKFQIGKHLCDGHKFEKEFSMKVMFPYVGSEYCIIVNEYNMQDVVIESRLKILCAASARARSVYEMKHPMFMLLTAHQDLMHAFLDAIKYVILDGDTMLLLNRLMTFINQQTDTQWLSDFYYGNNMLMNLMHADLLSREMQTICTVLTEQSPDVTRRNFCIPVTRLFHIYSYAVSNYGCKRKTYASPQQIHDLLSACKYTALARCL